MVVCLCRFAVVSEFDETMMLSNAWAMYTNLDNTSILVSAVLSGAGLCTVLALLLAWLRNFVRGAM